MRHFVLKVWSLFLQAGPSAHASHVTSLWPWLVLVVVAQVPQAVSAHTLIADPGPAPGQPQLSASQGHLEQSTSTAWPGEWELWGSCELWADITGQHCSVLTACLVTVTFRVNQQGAQLENHRKTFQAVIVLNWNGYLNQWFRVVHLNFFPYSQYPKLTHDLFA